MEMEIKHDHKFSKFTIQPSNSYWQTSGTQHDRRPLMGWHYWAHAFMDGISIPIDLVSRLVSRPKNVVVVVNRGIGLNLYIQFTS